MGNSVQLPGMHRVTKSTAGGGMTIYCYRHRGGPLLLSFKGASPEEALAKERAGQQALIAAYAATRSFGAASEVKKMRDLIRAYRQSPNGLSRLSPSTRKQWTRWLDRIDGDFGAIDLRHMEDRQATSALIQWRDELASRPRTADYAIQVIRRVLSFGCSQGLLERNAAIGIETIYRANRADVIVEPDELVAILENASPQAAFAIRFASETAMRRGDLVDLKWSEIRADRIYRRTNKSRGRTTLICPLSDEARIVIAELRAERQAQVDEGRSVSDCVFVTARGTPWTPDAMSQAFKKAARKAGVDKHLHDLRGTAITRMKLQGYSNSEIALFAGWEVSQVDKIIGRYVDGARIADEAIDRLEASRATG